MNNEIRTGRITSSEIVALTSNGRTSGSFGEAFYTYVTECVYEIYANRSLENQTSSLAMEWGKLCEGYVHKIHLGFEYVMQSQQTIIHPTINRWAGSPDGLKYIDDDIETVTDIKCPLTLKAFMNLVQSLYKLENGVIIPSGLSGDDAIKEIRKTKDGEKYYWQLVSNACITGAEYAELIVFMPYIDELEDILAYNAKLSNDSDDNASFRVSWAKDGELPYLFPERGIKNINIIRFKVPQEDKEFLTDRVQKAVTLIESGYIKLK